MRASKLIYRLQKWHTSMQTRMHTHKHTPVLLHEDEHGGTHTHTIIKALFRGHD